MSPADPQLLDLCELDLANLDFDELFGSVNHDADGVFGSMGSVFQTEILDERHDGSDGSDDRQEASLLAKRTPINGQQGPLEILICEPEGRTQRKLERILARMRCRMIVAETAERALQYVSNGVRFDLVIVGTEAGSSGFAPRLREASAETPLLIALRNTPHDTLDSQDFDAVLDLPLSRTNLSDTITKFYPSILTEHDDPESDSSWTQADDQERWQFAFKTHLRRFRDQNDRVSLITPPLLSKQRRKIHAMAHLYRLGHSSLGCGKYKRVLIVKCQLVKPWSSLNRWNPSRRQWMEGVVDSRIVTFKGVSRDASIEAISSWFLQSGVPSPALVHRQDCPREGLQCMVHMLFEQSYDAAIALEAVHGTTPSWSTSTVTCDYTVFKDCFWSPWQIPTDFNAVLAERVDPHQPSNTKPLSIKLESRSLSIISSEDDTLSESDLSDFRFYARSSTSTRYTAATTNPSTASLVTIATSQYSKPKAVDSASIHSLATTTSSNLPTISDSIPDYTSDVSATKRKRLPYSPSGYECSFACGKTFDHAGDCRKHEKIHEDRSHICEICGRAFLYPKDVRRHCQNVHVWKESLMAQRAERRVRPRDV